MSYRDRRAARVDRLRDWADQRDSKAAAASAAADAALDGIPTGQPILVGHHSQKGHERALARSFAQMGTAVGHAEKAEAMRARAGRIEQAAANAIYSDDPDLVERLSAKLAELESRRAEMKQRNSAFRAKHREALRGTTELQRDAVMPHPSYELRNLGGTISRTRARLAKARS